MNKENYVLIIKTIQIQPIRNLITALKDILVDATITFTPIEMKIINFDKNHTIVVNVHLFANNFEEYYCGPEKIIICANASHLFKVISTMATDDVLTIYIEKNDYNEGNVSELGLQYDNGDIKQCYSQKLKLLEPDPEELIVPQVEYSTIINLPTMYFQKIIRDLSGLSDRMEIMSVGNNLIFSCQGAFSKTKIYRSEADGQKTDGQMTFVKKPDESMVIQGEFSLKSLSNFIKCTPLCSHLEIFLGNDLPLIVKYHVASLGEIRLCLGPLS
jgi:proliferating cell nuclear antigen